MNKKIGLVIQGPLLSIGRTGNRLHDTPQQLVKDGGILYYDCRENINRIIREFGHLFSEIVISTWDNEVKPGEAFEGATLISVPDPGGIKQEGHYKDNNKTRQFLSTLNGIKELEKNGMEYAVKTRGDIYLDFEKLLESFFKGDTSKIGTTVVHPPYFLIHDLYFVAKTKRLREFCEAILAYDQFEFISSVHREIILKPAHVLYKEEIGVGESAYFPKPPPDGISGPTRKIFNYMFEHAFFSLEPQIWRETLWRGTLFSQDHFANLLGSKNKGQRSYNLPALITTDWDRFFAFRRIKSGVSASLLERFKAKIGMLGWSAWNYARKARRMLR